MLLRTVRHGSSEASWKTTARSGPGFVTAWPSTRMRPAVAAMRPSTTERNVVLPQPDGPTIATNSPSVTFRSTPSSATSRVLVRGWKYSRRMSCASSLAIIVAPATESDRRPPELDPPLDPADNFDQDRPNRNDREHADEDFVGLKAGAGLIDHHPDTRGRTINFANDNSDHAASDGKPEAGEEERDRAWQNDACEELPLARAEAHRNIEKPRVGGPDRRLRMDGDRQYSEQKDDQDFGGQAGPDPYDDEG